MNLSKDQLLALMNTIDFVVDDNVMTRCANVQACFLLARDDSYEKHPNCEHNRYLQSFKQICQLTSSLCSWGFPDQDLKNIAISLVSAKVVDSDLE